MLVHVWCAPTWRLHTELCKFLRNISTNICGLGKRRGVKLGEVSCLFISNKITISWLYSLYGFRFIFLLRDGENDLFLDECLFICPNQTLRILEDLSLYSQNLKYFGIPRYGIWPKCQFFSLTVEIHVAEHSAFVNRQIIRLMQFSCNIIVLFWTRKSYAKRWLYYKLFCTQ